MQTTMEYIATDEIVIRKTIEEGRERLKLSRRIAALDEEHQRKEIERQWREIERPLLEAWPWMDRYIDRNGNERKYAPMDYKIFFITFVFPGLAPVRIQVIRNGASYDIPDINTFTVLQIFHNFNIAESVWHDGCGTYRKQITLNRDRLPETLAIAEEIGAKFDEEMEAYQVALHSSGGM